MDITTYQDLQEREAERQVERAFAEYEDYYCRMRGYYDD